MPEKKDREARLAAVRALVLRHGWNSTCYQILNPGLEHWFDSDDRGVVGFVRSGRYWVAAGAPVCAADALSDVSRAFERAAEKERRAVVYLGAQERLKDIYEWRGDHSVVSVGAQPVWDPRRWSAAADSNRSLRTQLNRARNKDVTTSTWDPRRARDHEGVRQCLREWLGNKPLPAMHFMVEPNVLQGVVEDRVVIVAERQGRVAGFAIASPVPQRQGFLIEEIARSPSAPNGTAELLIDACMKQLAVLDARYATLGLVALARNAEPWMSGNPGWIRALFGWARMHGQRFYNFEGLEYFREKMRPDDWEGVYAVSNRRPFPITAFWAIAAAFCNGSPLRIMGIAMSKALRQEFRWARTGAAKWIENHHA